MDLPLRASNEGLLRPRVARAQKVISLHPFHCSGSKEPARMSCHSAKAPLKKLPRLFHMLFDIRQQMFGPSLSVVCGVADAVGAEDEFV